MNANNDTTNPHDSSLDVLVPLEFKPKAQTYTGKFLGKTWDTSNLKNGKTRRDLVLKIEIEEKNDLGEPYVIERRYNMLPRARGLGEFKEDMARFLDRELQAAELANQSRIVLDTKPVRIVFAKGRTDKAVFETFLPAERTKISVPEPATTSAPAQDLAKA